MIDNTTGFQIEHLHVGWEDIYCQAPLLQDQGMLWMLLIPRQDPTPKRILPKTLVSLAKANSIY